MRAMARLLVVDDERDVAIMLKFMLERAGHVVSLAHDGAEALAALGLEPADEAKEEPELVILDVMMPVMDGYAVCARMFENARTRGVPVIMLTGRGGMKDLHARTPNVAAHVDKPFDPAALRDLVTAMLQKETR
jgi:CheY-like chemotaxis protein